MPDHFDFAKAQKAYGREYLSARLKLQVERAASVFSISRTKVHVENIGWLHQLIRIVFRLSGLYGWAYRQFLDVQIVHNAIKLKNLPTSFDGFRILHLSDLHIDLEPSLTDVLLKKIHECSYDLCVLTGDYRNRTYGDYSQVETELKRLIPVIKAPVYAVLGNHDFIEMVQMLEQLQVKVLINERVNLTREHESIELVGVDESNVYMLDNLEKGLQGCNPEQIQILLSHSAGIYKQAEALDVDFVFSGHTHGGQLCLPGGWAPITNDTCSKKMLRGPWVYGKLQGYTSPGTGSCALPLRTFCPPEITVHTLHK